MLLYHPHTGTIGELIADMKARGSYLSITWGEDTQRFEVTFILHGVRYRGHDRDLLAALSVANERANRQYASRVAEEKATYRTDKEKG